jgi:hypothetical protein
MVAKKWIGNKPVNCDYCKAPLEGHFVDGAIYTGQWGILCDTCHQAFGKGLGLGIGQRYNLDTLENVGNE